MKPKPKAAPKTQGKRWLLTATELSEVLQIGRPRISQLVKEGLPKHDPHTYHLPDVIAWFRDFWTSKQPSNTPSESRPLDLARQREAEARTEKHLLELETMRGNLVRTTDAQAILGQLATWTAAELESIPGRVQADAKTRGAITYEAREAAKRLAARLNQCGQSLRDSGRIGEPDDAGADEVSG